MTTQKIKPILFSTEMVQAILAGRKTQTRRVVKEPMTADLLTYAVSQWKSLNDLVERYCEVKKGDILWVRETTVDLRGTFRYRADNDSSMKLFTGWKPSIFMPKEAARIFLKVTDVRAQRLQNINAADSVAEGIGDIKFNYHKSINPRVVEITAQIMAFRDLWDSINGEKFSWDTNPWVWVYTFEQTEKPDNFLNNETHHTTD